MIIAALFTATAPSVSGMGSSIKTEVAPLSGLTGNFTVILYGGRHFRDIETVAFLIPEGSPYTFEPYAPEFDYRIVKGVPAKDAFEMAEHFVRIQYAFLRSLTTKLVAENGKVIVYEVRPFYDPLTFGVEDVLDIDYSLRDDKVRIYVRLKPEVYRQLFSGDGSREGGK